MCILCVFCVQLSCFTKNFFFASHFFVDIFFSFRSYTFYFCVILAVVLYPEQKNYWYFEMYEVVSFHLFFGIIKLDGSLFVAFFMLVVSEVFSQILLICVCFTWKFLPVDDEILKWLSLFVVFILLFLFFLNVFVWVFFEIFFLRFSLCRIEFCLIGGAVVINTLNVYFFRAFCNRSTWNWKKSSRKMHNTHWSARN